MGTNGVIALACLALASSCSLVLDFSERADAAPDVNPNCESFEPNDTPETATPATPGTRQNAALCGADDLDLYRVDIVEFDDLTIVVEGVAGLNVELELSRDGLTIDSSDGPGADELINRLSDLGNQLEPGSYIVEVSGSSQASGDKEGDYSVLVTLTNNPPIVDAGVTD